MLEIERKYLLCNLPSKAPDRKMAITQIYFKNKQGVWERIRKSVYSNAIKYTHTIKHRISDMTNEEIENKLSYREYEKMFDKVGGFNNPHIIKERLIFENKKDKWEVDMFGTHHLIMAEIEIPSEDYDVKIPNYINDVILMEVTGNKKFTNRSLACQGQLIR